MWWSATHHCRHTCHAAASKRVEDKIPRCSVVQDIRHNPLGRHLRMEGMGVVNGAVPPNLSVLRKRLPEIVVCRRVVGLGMPGDELFDCDSRFAQIWR